PRPRPPPPPPRRGAGSAPGRPGLLRAAGRPEAPDAAPARRPVGGVGDRRRRCPGDRPPDAHKNGLKPWLSQEWCVPPGQSAAFVARMEDVLDPYTRPLDPARPLVCFDETSKQLVGEVQTPLPMTPGYPACYDTEDERHGTAN